MSDRIPDRIDRIEENLREIIRFIGDDPDRAGLLDTPKRMIRSWEHLFSGYNEDPVACIKSFDFDRYDEMVLLRDCELYSVCEHHFLPFWGKAHVAYIPSKGGGVVGVSKLARLVEVFSRRLQLQERICEQVASCLMDNLKCVGAACIIEATHLCMRMRGVEKQNSIVVTSSLKGAFLVKNSQGIAARQELLTLVFGGRSRGGY